MSYCSRCGAALQPGQRFCGECGAPVAGAAPPPAPAAVGATGAAELRLVSVLFVDLVGFTTLAESTDAEDTREFLSRYFALCRSVIGRHGGTVEKFIGDAVMAVWGAPTAHEDDAARAVRAAMELVRSVAEFGHEVRLPELRARGGVATGRAASWASSAEGLVVGDRVNTASRVQSAAPAGGVLVDQLTHEATASSIEYLDYGLHALKGKTGESRLWQALQSLGDERARPRGRFGEAILQGRERELDQLRQLVVSTLTQSRVAAVTVSGPAGVGKTRLLAELEREVVATNPGLVWHQSSYSSYGSSSPYAALASVVRKQLEVTDEDDPGSVATKLELALVALLPDPEERGFAGPKLAALLGLQTSQETPTRDDFFAAWRMFLERTARSSPLVLAIDNLQWADAGMLDFLEQLLELSEALPILLVALTRPELLQRRTAWASRPGTSLVQLGRLSDAEIETLLEELLPVAPGAGRHRIAERAEGIPLYAIETVNMLADRGLVVEVDGRRQLAEDLSDLDTPVTLEALIAARLDELEGEEGRLVKDLAVLGSSFGREAVVAVSGLDPEQADQLLRRLVEKEVLVRERGSRLPAPGEYGFSQTLLRGVAYERLGKRDRRSRHLAVARYFEEVSPDSEEQAEAIAVHYRDAFLADRAAEDAEPVRADAIRWLVRAAERAAAVGAPARAETVYLQAAELCTDDAEALGHRESAARMGLRAGRVREALELFQEVAQAHQEAGRPKHSARLAGEIGSALGRLGRAQEAIARLEEALAVLEEDQADPAVAQICSQLARELSIAGRAEEAEPQVERALSLARTLDLPQVLCDSMETKALLLRSSDQFEEALDLFDGTVEIATTRGLTSEELLSGHANSADTRMANDLDGAVEHLQAALSIARRVGQKYSETFLSGNLMLAQIFSGEWERVEQVGELLLQEARQGLEIIHGRMLLLHALRGEPEAARTALAGMARWGSSDSREPRTFHDALEGTVRLAEGDAEGALAGCQAVLEIALPAFGLRHEVTRQAWPDACDAAMALRRPEALEKLLSLLREQPSGRVPPYLAAQLQRYQALAGTLEESPGTGELFLEAVTDFSALGYPYWRIRSVLEWDRWAAEAGEAGPSPALVGQARAEAERLRAVPLLAGLATPISTDRLRGGRSSLTEL